MNNKTHNDTVYIAYKEPLNQHPQKCRIGVCAGTPVLDSGWHLFSCVKGECADEICAEILETFDDVRGTHYDSENEAWLFPINGLDRLLSDMAKDDKFRMQYFKDSQEKKMTKYIHYNYSPNAGNVLISDSPHEEGWHLAAEVESEKFNEALESYLQLHGKKLEGSILVSESAVCLALEIMGHLDKPEFLKTPYKVKLHEIGGGREIDGTLVYSRSVEQ